MVRQVGVGPLCSEFGAHGLGTSKFQLRHFIERVVYLLQATQTLQQRQRRLLAHPGHAGNIVDLVTHQRQQIDDQLGRDTKLGLDALDIQHRISHGIYQGRMLINQLGHILVTGRNDNRPRLGTGLPGQGANHVVCLYPRHAQQRQSHGAHNVVDGFHLLAQLVGHWRPLGLVGLEHLIAEGLALGIKHHNDRAVRVVLVQSAQHTDDAFDGAGSFTPGIGQWW